MTHQEKRQQGDQNEKDHNKNQDNDPNLTEKEPRTDNELEDGPKSGLDDEKDAGDQTAGSPSVTE